MTSIEAGPVTLPPVCEFAPPGSNWVCVNGGWVPAGHPLDPGSAQAPTSIPPPPPPLPPTEPPVVGPMDCTTVQPAATWICVNGGWLPPDHPLALAAPNESRPALTAARATNWMHNPGSVRWHPRVGWGVRKRWVGSNRAPAGTSGAVKPPARVPFLSAGFLFGLARPVRPATAGVLRWSRDQTARHVVIVRASR